MIEAKKIHAAKAAEQAANETPEGPMRPSFEDSVSRVKLSPGQKVEFPRLIDQVHLALSAANLRRTEPKPR